MVVKIDLLSFSLGKPSGLGGRSPGFCFLFFCIMNSFHFIIQSLSCMFMHQREMKLF